MVERHEGQRAYIFGQAPGVVEGEERRPWRGRAGQTLRRWLRLEEDPPSTAPSKKKCKKAKKGEASAAKKCKKKH